jgi:hypothetical protein
MRRFMKLPLIAGLAILVSACASSESQDAGQAATQDLAENTTGQKVRECRYAKATGTKMRTRICHLQEEWALIDKATEEAQDTDAFFRAVRENSTTAAGGGGGAAMPAGGGP